MQSITGTTIQVPTLDGRRLQKKIEDLIKPQTIIRFPGEGLPFSKQPSKRGDLLVDFYIQFPESLANSTRRKIADLL